MSATATYSKPFQNGSGDWRVREDGDDGVSVMIRLAYQSDATAGEHNDYTSLCGWCWLGAAHSGEAHRKSIGQRVEQERRNIERLLPLQTGYRDCWARDLQEARANLRCALELLAREA